MKNIGVFCSASNEIAPIYKEGAKQFGQWLGKHNKTLVFGGVNRGLMEILAQETYKEGGQVIGVVPEKLQEHASTFMHQVHTVPDLSQRKDIILQKSDVLVALAGGIGTLDEVFHVLANRILDYHQKKVIFYNTNHFYDELIQALVKFRQEGFIRSELSDLFAVANTEADLNILLNND